MNTRRLPKLDYWEPKTIDELLNLLESLQDDLIILAGGTDVVPMLKRRNTPSRHLVNIKKIPQLNAVSYDEEDGLKIGPAVTLREVITQPIVSVRYPILVQSARVVGFNQVRNMGTLGGNICLDNKCTYFNQPSFWWKSRPDCFKRGGDRCYVMKAGKRCQALSAADTVPALISLGTELVIQKKGKEKKIPLEIFYTGDGARPHMLDADEAVTAVLIPPPRQGWREGFIKKSDRGSVDFATASMALRLRINGGGVEDARIVLNSVSTKPIRARETEHYLCRKSTTSQTLEEALSILLKESAPLSMVGASKSVRENMLKAMFTDLTANFFPTPPPPYRK